MKRIRYSEGFGSLSSIILCLIIILTIIQIFLRAVLNIPFTGVEELSRYLFISVIFLGLPYSFRLDGHIKLEGIQKYFPSGIRHTIELLIHVSGILVFSVISFSAIYTVSSNYDSETPTIGIPFWLFFMPTMMGFLLLTFEHIQTLVYSFKPGK
jgi:TRAP-type C4-dicarboxylate transport system permease small subunit